MQRIKIILNISAIKRQKSKPLLINRTKEERERLITEKVAIVLMGEEGNAPSVAVNISHSTQPVGTTETLQKYQNKVSTV
jgi:hypothetical protein